MPSETCAFNASQPVWATPLVWCTPSLALVVVSCDCSSLCVRDIPGHNTPLSDMRFELVVTPNSTGLRDICFNIGILFAPLRWVFGFETRNRVEPKMRQIRQKFILWLCLDGYERRRVSTVSVCSRNNRLNHRLEASFFVGAGCGTPAAGSVWPAVDARQNQTQARGRLAVRP